MEFQTCKNCCLIDKVIENQIQKYDTLSKENISIHNALMNSKDTIIQMESEIVNLCDGLLAEKQNILRTHIQQFSKHLPHKSESEEHHHHNQLPGRQCRGLIPARLKDKPDYISSDKYSELKNLVNKQNQMYEDDLDLFRSLSDKCNEKLKEKLEEMRPHISLVCEMCEVLGNDFLKERQEAIECRQLIDNTIQTIKFQQAKQLINIENEIIINAKNSANAEVRETGNIMKIQLANRDKLITKLRRQQAKMEAFMEKQEQKLHKNQQDHEQALIDLEKRLLHSKRKYKLLGLRHSLEGQGFRTDITNISKEIKQMKDKICSKSHNCEIYSKIKELEDYVNAIDAKISLIYCT